MRSDPAFAAAVQRGVVGDDPLGLASTNEKLYNSALPGFNNYVRYIRVYSALCWTIKQVENALHQGQARTVNDAREILKHALQKIELALVWFNKGGVPQLAGTGRVFPSTNMIVDLKFSTFGTSEASLFEPDTYRPSLTTGLRFIDLRKEGTYACSPAGDSLASAFDDLVQQAPGRRWLRSMTDARTRYSKILELGSVLSIHEPSANERTAFLDRFFPKELAEDASNDDQARFLTLRLMFRAIAADSAARLRVGESDRLTIEEVRACMARGEAMDGSLIVGPEHARVHAWWAVLQLRQLQRIAQEAIYCVVERWIAAGEGAAQSRPIAACVEELGGAGAKFLAKWNLQSVAEIHKYLEETRGDSRTLYQAAARFQRDEDGNNDADVFEHIEALMDPAALELNDDGCLALAYACFALVFCGYEVRRLETNVEALRTMSADGDSCSLLQLAVVVDANKEASAIDLLRVFVRDWAISRHFQVVAVRSAQMDGKNRFRFIVGDEGLERFDRTVALPTPKISEDKLAHALYLCTQAGLLSERNGCYKLTAQGRRHVQN